MKLTSFILITVVAFTNFANAQDCQQQFNQQKQKFYLRFKVSERRAITQRIIKNLTEAEGLEIKKLAQEFNNIPHDTPDHQDQRIVLQDRAKTIVRTVVTRSGYKIMNPAEGSPFDAQIGEIFSSDGYSESIIEVRSLLILGDAFPHLTIWMNRFGPVQNPWKVVTVGIMNDAFNDYVSWMPASGPRVSASLDTFIKTLLPTQCRN